MTVQCPNCSTKYRFDDSRLQKHLKVRCIRCRHVFTLPFPDGDEDIYPDKSPGVEKSSREAADSSREQQFQEDKHVEDTPQEKTGPTDTSRLIKIGAVLLLLLIIAGSLYVTLPRIAEHVYIPFISSERDTEEVLMIEAFSEEDVRDISLENVRQYFVSNDDIGQLFVVEGRAVNEFDTPRSRIKLRAVLYDHQ